MGYYSEAEKIKPVIEKYLCGKIVDIGSSDHPICPEAITVDGSQSSATVKLNHGVSIYNLATLYPELLEADVVFSSHCLEHLVDDTLAISKWSELLKKDGHLILYLPDGRKYNNYENQFHFRDYTYPQFMMFFKRAFCGEGIDYDHKIEPTFELVDSSEHFGEDLYSFYVIAKKL